MTPSTKKAGRDSQTEETLCLVVSTGLVDFDPRLPLYFEFRACGAYRESDHSAGGVLQPLGWSTS